MSHANPMLMKTIGDYRRHVLSGTVDALVCNVSVYCPIIWARQHNLSSNLVIIAVINHDMALICRLVLMVCFAVQFQMIPP